jgi:hypothetical protein
MLTANLCRATERGGANDLKALRQVAAKSLFRKDRARQWCSDSYTANGNTGVIRCANALSRRAGTAPVSDDCGIT